MSLSYEQAVLGAVMLDGSVFWQVADIVSEADFAKLTKIPMQFVWGDHIEDAPQWARAFAQCRAFAKAVNERGGHVEVLRLPDAGLHGNSHIAFADLNNDAVAKLSFAWLKREGFK